MGAAIRNFLPGSPVKVGPLTALNNIASNPGAEIVNMLARGVQAAVPTLQSAMGNVGVTATLGNPVLDRGIGVPSDAGVADRDKRRCTTSWINGYGDARARIQCRHSSSVCESAG